MTFQVSEAQFHTYKFLKLISFKNCIFFEKKICKNNKFLQIMHIYSKGTPCVNRYIVPLF